MNTGRQLPPEEDVTLRLYDSYSDFGELLSDHNRRGQLILHDMLRHNIPMPQNMHVELPVEASSPAPAPQSARGSSTRYQQGPDNSYPGGTSGVPGSMRQPAAPRYMGRESTPNAFPFERQTPVAPARASRAPPGDPPMVYNDTRATVQLTSGVKKINAVQKSLFFVKAFFKDTKYTTNPFQLDVDTGARDSWVYRKHFRRIPEEESQDAISSPIRVDPRILTDWPRKVEERPREERKKSRPDKDSSTAAGSSSNPLDLSTIVGTKSTLPRDGYIYPDTAYTRIRYKDGTIVAAGLTKIRMLLPHWGYKHSRDRDKEARCIEIPDFYVGSAQAVTAGMVCTSQDGLLGLAPYNR
ncbi:hypothetical protein K474DRAFT_243336 [Panus rudis PR-1116 ss-1]|nr:hypothetical protein K474DRAFT_243336 [Panus rudis PR-1116 ss-1]